MRTHLAVAATLAPFLVAGTAVAHHMAAGIVSDDLYETIEENLEGSPHLDLDLSTIGSMAVTTVTVDADDVSAVLDAVSDTLMGQGVQRESSLEIDISEPDDEGLVTIIIEEKMGTGQSQVVEPRTR